MGLCLVMSWTLTKQMNTAEAQSTQSGRYQCGDILGHTRNFDGGYLAMCNKKQQGFSLCTLRLCGEYIVFQENE